MVKIYKSCDINKIELSPVSSQGDFEKENPHANVGVSYGLQEACRGVASAVAHRLQRLCMRFPSFRACGGETCGGRGPVLPQ